MNGRHGSLALGKDLREWNAHGQHPVSSTGMGGGYFTLPCGALRHKQGLQLETPLSVFSASTLGKLMATGGALRLVQLD